MEEKRIRAGNGGQQTEVSTFRGMLSVHGLGHLSGAHASLTSYGDLVLQGWKPDQLRGLSECALFLADRLDETHAPNGDAESQAAHDVKPSVVLEMSPKAGGNDQPLERIEVS